MDANKPARSARIVVLSLLGAAALIVAAGIAALFLPGTTAKVESVADRLDVPAEWTPASDGVRPDTWICLGDNPCPSLYRSWTTSTPMTPDLLVELAADVSSDFETPSELCFTEQFCSISGTVDIESSRFSVRLSYSPSVNADGYDVVIEVRPAF